MIAAVEANHPHLTTQKSFYVEISRARDRAELVTDDRETLRERLEAATGERISALDAVERNEIDRGEMARETERVLDRGAGSAEMLPEIEKPPTSKHIEHDLGL